MGRLRLEDIHLDELYITGGMKTDAGKNRMVPIHSRIVDLVRKNYENAQSLESEFLLNDPDSPKGGIHITYDKYAGRFFKVMEALPFSQEHRPHDPRNTFVTRMKKAGVDPLVVKRLVGHKINDVTEKVYTYRDLDWLREDIEKMS